MDYRQLGRSGLLVPVLTFGTATFGGQGDFFGALGDTGAKEAERLVDICLDAGLCMFDTANVYSTGASEELLGTALKGRRSRVLLSTKVSFRVGAGPNDVGSSRIHMLDATEKCLKRLQTDHIDLLLLHGFDAMTPQDEVLSTLDNLIKAGKVRYIGASNFGGWQLMKALAISDRLNLARYVAHQAFYSLIGRDYEADLMPLALDQGVGTMVWGGLGWGRLTGKIGRHRPMPEISRLHKTKDAGPPLEDAYVYEVVDALEEISMESGKTVPQIALNWLLQRPTISTVIIGARTEGQLNENIGALGWKLTREQIQKLDKASNRPLVYPYWHQVRTFKERNPRPV